MRTCPRCLHPMLDAMTRCEDCRYDFEKGHPLEELAIVRAAARRSLIVGVVVLAIALCLIVALFAGWQTGIPVPGLTVFFVMVLLFGGRRMFDGYDRLRIARCLERQGREAGSWEP